MNYQERWNATAKMLGYTIVRDRDDKESSYMKSPDGEEIWGTIHRTGSMDFTHYRVVQDIEKRFNLKWNTRPYLEE